MTKSSTVAVKQIRNLPERKLSIGFDLGDRSSYSCVLDEAGEVVHEQKLSTTPNAVSKVFAAMPEARLMGDKLMYDNYGTTSDNAKQRENLMRDSLFSTTWAANLAQIREVVGFAGKFVMRKNLGRSALGGIDRQPRKEVRDCGAEMQGKDGLWRNESNHSDRGKALIGWRMRIVVYRRLITSSRELPVLPVNPQASTTTGCRLPAHVMRLSADEYGYALPYERMIVNRQNANLS